MKSSLRLRLVIIGIVVVFALFNLYPTLKWATLSDSRKAQLTARWEKLSEELREDLISDRLSPKEKLADIRLMLAPIQDAHKKLDKTFWERVNSPDLTALDEDEKDEFLSLCGKMTGKENLSAADSTRIQEALARLREVQKRLDKEFWQWVENPRWGTLGKKDQEKYRGIILQLTGKRIPRTPSVLRNLGNWLARWWQGDETQIISLGLDLKGGSYFVLEVERPKGASLRDLSDATDGAVRVLSDRIDITGVREPIIRRQGINKIIVQLPGVTDVNRQRTLIQRQASMRWMLVAEDLIVNLKDPAAPPQFPDDRLLLLYKQAEDELKAEFKDKKDQQGNPLQWTISDLDRKLENSLPPEIILRIYEHQERRRTGGKVTEETPLLLREPQVLTGDQVTSAQASTSYDTGEPVINFRLNREGEREFADVTSKYSAQSDKRIGTGEGARGWRLAILLDEKVISAPTIRTAILGGSGQIEGDFTWQEATDLAIQLKAGSLRARINILAQNTVGPTLGADSIRKGVSAAILGLACVVFFMAVYYLLAGLIANFALALNMLIILGIMAALRATLTLPGIAGIILTIGMAVDANVLINERIREELAGAKKLAAAIESGYHKAFITILDSNVTTVICGIVLYYLGTGPVRGFAVTLIIGIATSMFTAIVVTRVVFDLLLKTKRFQRLPMLALFRSPKVDFVRQMKKASFVSMAVIAAGMISFGAKWSKNFGIDFSSGQSATIVFKNQVTRADLATIRKTLSSNRNIEDFNLVRFRLQGEHSDRGITVNAKLAGGSKSASLAQDVTAALPDNPVVGQPSEETIYPAVSRRLWKEALFAVMLSLLAMLIYIWWRFEFRFALGGIIALFHDVLVTVAFLTGFGILGTRQLSLPIVAAILTIIGYSINDTIVIFDRIREDMKIMKGVDLRTIINTAVNQTLGRTILTSGTTLMAVGAILFFGGQAMNDFAFAMFIGCVAGVYSTVYIASPIALLLEKTR